MSNAVCEEETDKASVWEFVEASQRTQCSCSRYTTELLNPHVNDIANRVCERIRAG